MQNYPAGRFKIYAAYCREPLAWHLLKLAVIRVRRSLVSVSTEAHTLLVYMSLRKIA